MKRKGRDGVSLIEVLISTFVLSIGLLGLAALIPVGRFAIVETGKADRAGACGRAATRDLRVRDMLNLWKWYYVDVGRTSGNPTATLKLLTEPAEDANQAPGSSFCIDPLFVARNFPLANSGSPEVDLNTALIEVFPYRTTASGLPRLRRTSLGDVLVPGAAAGSFVPSEALANRIFTWQDDLVFDVPDDRQLRPGAIFDQDVSDPANPTEVRQQMAGDYSWMITVTPVIIAEKRFAGSSKVSLTPGSLHTVSVVVFYKRDLAVNPAEAKPTERMVTANILGGGYGGGDVYEETGANGPIYCRDVTLAGPDWKEAWCYNVGGSNGDPDGVLDDLDDLDGDGWFSNAEAVLVDGVIGVYTTTIEWN